MGSIAHATMLGNIGVLSKAESKRIVKVLEAIGVDIEEGRFEWNESLEDVHMNIEAELTRRDPAGAKLHTGRSRNDQVATDFRLWVRGQIDWVDKNLVDLMKALLDQAQNGVSWIMPGFTHLQTAQPITWGHHMMAYVEMFSRDRSRFKDARDRMNECPLGSAALAGTSFPIDRNQTAKALEFDRPTANSLDAVSDRDFALEFLASSSICAMHLSRLAEELVIWSSAQFRFIELSDRFSTGSSIMPQKKNPDAAELVRAKIGRILGANVGLMTVMKGLPLAYSKDMQEDKEQVFDAADSLNLALCAMEGMIKDLTANKDSLEFAAKSGFSTATDLADWLVRVLNLPFREAHHITGELVGLAEQLKCDLSEIKLKEMQRIHSGITEDVFTVLSIENSVKSRSSYGGTSPEEVQFQIDRWKKELG